MDEQYTELKTLGELRDSGWESLSVKDEIRKNVIRKIESGETLFPGILGYDKSVIPELQHALLSKHDFILLGLRGQAKTKILRQLPAFLDEYAPVVKGSQINDDPLNPVSKQAIEMIDEHGEETPIEWIHRSQRYGEKLATPDTAVGDLIGDIDPIKAAAQKLTLADENVINFGLVPRTNRGIFAINELPDLQPRIQVSLLNIMQERDIQIRGFNIRIPVDVLMVFSANPEDYTNRGNIITPLKDRIDAQILTHYPRKLEIGKKITSQEAWFDRNSKIKVNIPDLLRELLEQVAFEARESEYIDQKSGVSTRMTITAMEQLISSAERRALVNGEKRTTARITDLFHVVPALTGKLELVYEGEQEGSLNVVKHLIGKAIKKSFKRIFPDPEAQKKQEDPSIYQPLLDWFANGNTLELTDNMSGEAYEKALEQVEGLGSVIKEYGKDKQPENRYILMDFVIESLHQYSMLGKEEIDNGRSYSDMLGSMLGSIDDLDNLEDFQ
ncbi:sigma 54-interacting transcriptional regulator [Aliifodinibius salicampi]|uniref:Sigma 54-interacting transcriptional regulator n=1 Tax=Fodinibius salicampi TaxID=1920655 RepID=A0ABT3PVY0_9BACT|nr:sigma 54-interacting transcriptional regulator [Fodinibius salicampi]MCW9712009.1 sigma 54-interacting transcriptional regulator [Fodinibius salicampi]